ncbi:anti-sigma factor [Limnobacter parvus]|uniref:Regulator of SigK n=1 Tax=Limnobacter parvus TaxID=2939690 RepID=A0ABT1XM89_9BURK|nr:anti-sigma factor [Limnobacter parvus]MCR2747199.1 anti-sigma factor [Limnobacter parvus]
MTETQAEARIIEAGEYVLGVMTDAERFDFEQRLSQEPELALEVKSWTEHFAAMSQKLDQEPVNPRVWAKVDQSVAKANTAGNASPLAWLWKGWAVAASAAVVVLGVQLLGASQGASDAPRYVAVMKSPDKTTEWLVEAMADDTIRVYQIGNLPIEGNPANMGKTLQLWTKAPNDPAPTSLGLMEWGKPMVVRADKLPDLVEKQLFEVTLEPAGGSPLGNQPSGEIMFIGNAVALK